MADLKNWSDSARKTRNHLAQTAKSEWELLLNALAPVGGERILDVGAGKGTIAGRVQAASKGVEVYAVDPNERRVASMKHDFPVVKSSVAGAEGLPFPDSYFDKAYTTMALHHFADFDKALSELARVIKQGGSFVVLEVDPHSAKGNLFRFAGRLMGEHMTMMSEDQLAAKLRAAGTFKVAHSVKHGSGYLIQLTRT